MFRAKAKDTNEVRILFRAQLESCNAYRDKRTVVERTKSVVTGLYLLFRHIRKTAKSVPSCPSVRMEELGSY